MTGKEITPSIVHYNETLLDITKRFPEISSSVEKHVDKAVKTNKYEKIIVGLAYSLRDGFPKSMSVKIECLGKKPSETILHFKSKWTLE